MVSVSSTAILIVIDKLGNNNNNNDQTSGFASDQTWCDHPFESMIIPRVVREEILRLEHAGTGQKGSSAAVQRQEILKLVQKSRGLETAVDFQVALDAVNAGLAVIVALLSDICACLTSNLLAQESPI